jgi:hypothetical protein
MQSAVSQMSQFAQRCHPATSRVSPCQPPAPLIPTATICFGCKTSDGGEADHAWRLLTLIGLGCNPKSQTLPLPKRPNLAILHWEES